VRRKQKAKSKKQKAKSKKQKAEIKIGRVEPMERIRSPYS